MQPDSAIWSNRRSAQETRRRGPPEKNFAILLTLRSTTGFILSVHAASAARKHERGAMNAWKRTTGKVGRRIAAAVCAAALSALSAGPCAAALFAAAETDAHACCGHGGGHSSMPPADACERLCASAASVPPTDTPAPALSAGASPAPPGPDPAAAMRRGAPRPATAPAVSPPRFVLHCAFLI